MKTEWVEVYREAITDIKTAPRLRATLHTAEKCGRLARARMVNGEIVIEVRAPVPKALKP